MMQRLFAKKELIYTVYQERSFSKAAQKLFISQPSLSTMIRQVEEEVGLPLIDRSCKPIRMTGVGMAYINATEEIRRIEQDFYNYLCAVNNLQAGTLNIGSNQLFSSMVLPEYVSEFVSRYPKIKLDLLNANSAELQEKLISGQLDLIIDNKELDTAHFDRRDFQTEYLLLAVPKALNVYPEACEYCLTTQDVLKNRHRDPSTPAVPLHFFEQAPFILMTRDNDTRTRSDAIFHEAGFNARVLLEIDRFVTLYNYISRGIAAAIVSDSLIQHLPAPLESIVYYKLGSEFARRGVYIHTKRNKDHTRAMEIFENLVCSKESTDG